jgi:hypothetical protein
MEPSFHRRLFGELQREAATGEFRFTKLKPPAGETYLPFEPSVGNFEPMNEAAARDHARTSKSHNENSVGIDRYRHGFLFNAGEQLY